MLSGKSKNTKIELNDLQGDPLEINWDELEQVEGEFEEQVINSPDDITFDQRAYKVVLGGFTKVALKNIITVAKTKVRLFEVGEDSINLLSCSDTPFETDLKDKSVFIVEKKNCCVKVLPGEGNEGLSMKFDFKTGVLGEIEKFNFWKDEKVVGVKSFDLPKPKNSRIESYLYAVIDPKDEPQKYHLNEFVKFRKNGHKTLEIFLQ